MKKPSLARGGGREVAGPCVGFFVGVGQQGLQGAELRGVWLGVEVAAQHRGEVGPGDAFGNGQCQGLARREGRWRVPDREVRADDQDVRGTGPEHRAAHAPGGEGGPAVRVRTANARRSRRTPRVAELAQTAVEPSGFAGVLVGFRQGHHRGRLLLHVSRGCVDAVDPRLADPAHIARPEAQDVLTRPGAGPLGWAGMGGLTAAHGGVGAPGAPP